MPYDTQVWVDDQPRRFTVYIDESLISELGARFLENVLDSNIRHWQRRACNPRANALRPAAS